ncbi:hypothetical protein GW17_00036140 [Ensete ventricosum]|nr:hypothetical protein GW17_00036140 [Ensete ventricosum]
MRRRLALFVPHEEGGVASSYAGTRRRLTSFVPHGVASRRETSDLTVPPDNGSSVYRYPVGPVCTAHTERCMPVNVLPSPAMEHAQSSMIISIVYFATI